jgi:hypothetical protein
MGIIYTVGASGGETILEAVSEFRDRVRSQYPCRVLSKFQPLKVQPDLAKAFYLISF